MTTDVDVCNRALMEAGARKVISTLNDPTPAGVAAALIYTPMRQQLLRTAPWGFCRKTAALTLLGSLATNPPTAPYPWGFKYAYPQDCQKFRYVLPLPPNLPAGTVNPPIVGTPLIVPWCAPRRDWRFLVAYDDSGGEGIDVLLSNVCNAIGVYNADVTNPDRWDSLFTNAMVMALANKFIIPLTGNVGMKQGFAALADKAIMEARAASANEAITHADPKVDWLEARRAGGWFQGVSGAWENMGSWYGPWENMNWSS